MASKEVVEDFRGNDTSPFPDVYDDLTGSSSGPHVGSPNPQNWQELDQSFGNAAGSFRRAATGTTLAPPAIGQARYARLPFNNLFHTAGTTVIEVRLVPGMALTGTFDSVSSDFQFGIGVALDGSGTIEWDFTPIHTYTGTAPGALATLRVEVESAEARFYVDGVLKHTKSGGVAYSTKINRVQLEMPGFYTAHGRPVGVLDIALDALKIKTETTSGPLLPTGPVPDTTAPEMTGVISVTFPTANSFTASYSAATDDVAVTGYEYSIDGGAYVSNGTSLSLTVSGIPTGAVRTLAVRAFDDAGNRSTALTSTIYMALVAIPGGAAPNKFPVGTEWDFDDFVLAQEVAVANGGEIAISGDGNTVALMVQTEVSSQCRVYARNGDSYELVTTLTAGAPGLHAAATVHLDWTGKRLVVVQSNDLTSFPYPAELGLCQTFGLSASGWVLMGEQFITGFNHYYGVALDVRGQRLAISVGWPGRLTARGTRIFAWDTGTWKENEAYSFGSAVRGLAAVAADTETGIDLDLYGSRFKELTVSAGVVGPDVAVTTPDYNDTVGIAPTFRGLGFFAVQRQSLSGLPTTVEEYRRYTHGWALVKRTASSELWPERQVASVACSEDGTVMVATANGRWAWFFRKVSLLRLPEGFDPTPTTPDPDEPPGPSNEPTSDYALFWTNFNATYEVP